MIDRVPEVLADSAITLRRYRLEDAGTLKESSTVSHEHLRQYMPWALEMPTDGSVVSFIKEAAEDFRTSGNANFAITRTEDGAYVGGCGIHDRVGPGALEIGYWVDVRHLRQGIATATARLLTYACFAAGVERVELHCDVSNEASASIARRLGYTLREVQERKPLAASETDHQLVWVKRNDERPDQNC
jgi:RimJ/RimL family protein N-acetyltransferase